MLRVVSVDAVSRPTLSPRSVAMHTVLDVFADFDQFGGASIGLVAWELDVDPSNIVASWTQAINDGLLERSGSDTAAGYDEELWSLTDRGRQMQTSCQDRLSN